MSEVSIKTVTQNESKGQGFNHLLLSYKQEANLEKAPPLPKTPGRGGLEAFPFEACQV